MTLTRGFELVSAYATGGSVSIVPRNAIMEIIDENNSQT